MRTVYVKFEVSLHGQDMTREDIEAARASLLAHIRKTWPTKLQHEFDHEVEVVESAGDFRP